MPLTFLFLVFISIILCCYHIIDININLETFLLTQDHGYPDQSQAMDKSNHIKHAGPNNITISLVLIIINAILRIRIGTDCTSVITI